MAVNHATVNAPWNFFYSIKKASKINSYNGLLPTYYGPLMKSDFQTGNVLSLSIKHNTT